jgi:hypothetical protein
MFCSFMSFNNISDLSSKKKKNQFTIEIKRVHASYRNIKVLLRMIWLLYIYIYIYDYYLCFFEPITIS